MQSSIDPAVWVEIINKGTLAFVAVVAMIVGPALQWRIAKRQTELQKSIAERQAELQQTIAQRMAADNVSAKRQNWIDELRKDMSEFLTVMARLNELRRPAKGLSKADEVKNFEDVATYNFRGSELGIRIKLRLNPNEEEHNKLVSLLGELSDASADPPPNETPEHSEAATRAFRGARDKVVAHMQMILKHEWERVKKGVV
jgi:hypothetical protein